MLEAVIFDMDGVIVDTEILHVTWLHEFLKSQGISRPIEDIYPTIGISNQNFFKVVASLLGEGWSEEDSKKEFLAYETKKNHSINYSRIFRQDIRLIVNYCQENGIKLGLASSSSMAKIQDVLEQCQLKEDFQLVVSGEMFRESKPNPEIYLYTAAKMNCKPEHCLVIEDSAYGIEAGKKAGMTVIAYEDTRFNVVQTQADMIQPSMVDILSTIKALHKKRQ